MSSTPRHPTTAHWRFPPDERPPLPAPLARVNLRELAARPERFEHHLMVVARVGVAQLEVATASEPLYFAHHNISDEYALPMATGDPMVEMVPFRVFLSDAGTGEDVARINHGVGQLVLHPHGYLHWPGRLRPPHQAMQFAPGTRRAGYSLVFCASAPTPPAPDRPLFVSVGREAGPKAYGDADVPILLADLRAEAARPVALVGDTALELLVQPAAVTSATGAYLIVLDGASDTLFPGDLVHLPPGAVLDAAGVERALVMRSPSAVAEAPPESWRQGPPPPFPVYEEGAPGQLPCRIGDLEVTEASAELVSAAVAEGPAAEIPRTWLARMLFRIALHGYRVGYVETYGGFFYDDTNGRHRLGVRGGGAIELTPAALARAIERLYRAVAPPGYVERIT